mmetsp:Transcript_45171/g.82707  ORF Transcript_45171/g.82707 Transcript_45171/m.82707 type:complete len:235 (+) Transcript_45171:331-1035(+)
MVHQQGHDDLPLQLRPPKLSLSIGIGHAQWHMERTSTICSACASVRIDEDQSAMQAPRDSASAKQRCKVRNSKCPVLEAGLLLGASAWLRRRPCWYELVLGHVTEEAEERLTVRRDLHPGKEILHLNNINMTGGVTFHRIEPGPQASPISDELTKLFERLKARQPTQSLHKPQLHFEIRCESPESSPIDVPLAEGKLRCHQSGTAAAGEAQPEHQWDKDIWRHQSCIIRVHQSE